MIEVSNLTKRFRDFTAVDRISFEVSAGEIFGFLGPNGSGKSTLIKCIDRILTPQSGSILIDRKEITKMKRMDVARNIAYVPQNSLRIFPNNVVDMVLMDRRPHLGWLSSDDDEEKVWDVLRLLGIEDLGMSNFNELSGGQQQKALLARALVQEAEVLLLDEPTSNLDIWHQLDVMNIIRTLVDKKAITALMAVHDLNLTSRYSDRMIMMKGGRIVAAGAPSDVLTPENIESVYNVEAAVRRQSETPYIVPLKQVAMGRKG